MFLKLSAFFLCLIFTPLSYSISLNELNDKPQPKKEIIDRNYKIINKNPMVKDLNLIRSKFGLKNLQENLSLKSAAINHAYYLSDKDYVSHDQIYNDKKFTGATPLDRAVYSGYNKGESFIRIGEVVAMYNGRQHYNDLENFLVAIYHRFSILEPSFKDYGEIRISDGYKNIAEMKLGTTLQQDELKYIYYPVNNQINIPTYFYPSQEIPNPMPNYNKVGYPISFQITEGAILDVENFIMTDSSGNILKGKFLTSKTDGNVLKSQFAFIPYQELKNDESYDIKIAGKMNSEGFLKSWKFKTEAKRTPYLNSDKIEYYPNEIIKIDYGNISDINMKMEIETFNSDGLILKIISKKNSWGYVELEALSGCKSKKGCDAIFTLKLNNGESYSKKFIIYP